MTMLARIDRALPLLAMLVSASGLLAVATAGGCEPHEIAVGSNALGAGGDSGSVLVDLGSTPVAQNAPGCPEHMTSALQTGLSCALANGDVCAYQYAGGGWGACMCGCQEDHVWSCQGAGTTPGCPSVQPVDGVSCAGWENHSCPFFPSTMCNCGGVGSTWSCGPTPGPSWACLAPPNDLQPDDSGVDPGTAIDALTSAEAQAWCTWYVGTYGAPSASSDAPVASDGTTEGFGARFCVVSEACFPSVDVHQCTQSLAAQPCAATVQDLDDCVETLHNGCYLVGQGCSAFLSQPSCSGTIVAPYDGTGGGPSCRIRVQ